MIDQTPELRVDEIDFCVSPLSDWRPDEWNMIVTESNQGTVYHRYEFLDVMEEHTGTTCTICAVFHRDAPIAVLPLYVYSKGLYRAVFSPPPGVGIPFLGPVCVGTDEAGNFTRLAIQQRLLNQCSEWVHDEIAPVYVSVTGSPAFDAFAPFEADVFFGESPKFTYSVDLTRTSDEIIESFSSDARNNVTSFDEDTYSLSVGGVAAIHRIVDHLERRYVEQGHTFSVPAAFVTDLYDRLPPGTIRPYVLTIDGSFATGMITLEDETTMYRWQGGAKPQVDLPVTDLLDWHLMQEAMDRNRSKYDLVGANIKRLCGYKAKFNPTLEVYYNIKMSKLRGDILSSMYRWLRRSRFGMKLG